MEKAIKTLGGRMERSLKNIRENEREEKLDQGESGELGSQG